MKERQWELRENAILDAAAELLNTKGFSAMTLEDITETIGISRPTLYLHFKSKEDVIAHVVIRNLCDFSEILSQLDPAQTPGERLRHFMRLAMDRRFSKTKLAMYDMTKIKLTHGSEMPELRDAECKFSASLAVLVREAQESGEVWNGMSAEMLVLTVSSFIKNLEIDTLLAEGKVTREEIEDSALRIIFRE